MVKTYIILISGQVQGVGFRPYVFTLAQEFLLNGTVSNNEKGVVIYLSGLQEAIYNFYTKLLDSPPPVSKIKNSSIKEITYRDFKEFSIIPSDMEGSLNLPLTPDFAICDNCKDEIIDPENRRYYYPFTTCVNCGPRWAITQTFPFERENTSIDKFPMCTSCEEEYKKPVDRRFHSQTNTCTTCGINYYFTDFKGTKIDYPKKTIFSKIAEFLGEGKIIAIKNTSGYLLCCNAENATIVQELRKRKHRPRKPFAVLFPSIKLLKQELTISNEEEQSLRSPERPIVILPLKNYKGTIAVNDVAPNLNQLGVMLPYSGILQLLANELSFPIVATSGNIHGSPIISTENEALGKLQGIADYFLQHDLLITHPQDDSVIKFSNKYKTEIIFRRSRGYAPNYFGDLVPDQEKILALGAHLKSSIAFYPNEYLYLSQYLGNLNDFDVYNRFTDAVYDFINIFEQEPEVILVDKHPLYAATTFGKELAMKLNSKLVEIQHHKAHFTAILGEYDLFAEKVMGVVFDGTGYGDDKNIWGGEFFDYEDGLIKRIDHLEYFDWFLGDKMSMEPRLSLLALANEEMHEVVQCKFSEKELKSYRTLLKNNSLKTSSIGRLFDAVASLLNITDLNSYEGEAPVLLENKLQSYNIMECINYWNTNSNKIEPKLILNNIYLDLIEGIAREQLIANFLFTLASIILGKAKQYGYTHIALSGGVFQNSILIDMLQELAPNNVTLYFHKKISPNDENISFGQFMYYTHIKNK